MPPLVMRMAALTARILPPGIRQALYRLGPLTRSLRSLLNRSTPVGTHPVTIAAGELAGMQLLLDLQVDKDLWLGTYEPQVTRAVRDLARPGMTAYDLGANVGYVTMLLAKAVGEGGRVVAVEPLPANVDRLRAALKLNRMESRVTIVQKAVGAATLRGRFLVHTSPGMGRLEGTADRAAVFEESIEVEVISIDDLVYAQGQPPPDVVKIDLEGGEGQALQGMGRVLSEAHPILLIEVHSAAAADEVWSRLTSAGYLLQDLDRSSRRVSRRDDLRPKSHLLARAEGGQG